MCHKNSYSDGLRGACFDVAVVGAGPAGCLTAAIVAQAGLSVLLLEKKRLPRDKVCGGLISSRALALLPPEALPPQGMGTPVTAVQVHSRGKTYLYRAGQPLGAVIRRADFDLWLANYARSCGAVLVEESPLVHLEKHQAPPPSSRILYRLHCGGAAPATFEARCVVGADGARSRCAVLSGLRRRELLWPAGWGYTREIAPPPENEEAQTVHFYTLPFKGGLGWSFPGEGWVNRGVGAPLRPSRLQSEYRRLFPEDAGGTRAAAWPLPFTGPLGNPARDNLLLVGDAAGLVDPFSGEGIFNALKSALMAGSAIKTAFRENCYAGALYTRLFRGHFHRGFLPSLIGAVLLHARCLINPAGAPRAFAAIMRNRCRFSRDLEKALLNTAEKVTKSKEINNRWS